MPSFWIHTNGEKLLDGGGYEASLGRGKGLHASTKVTVWMDKDAVLVFCKRHFKGETVRDSGTFVDVDLAADEGWPNRPARTLRFQEVTIVAP